MESTLRKYNSPQKLIRSPSTRVQSTRHTRYKTKYSKTSPNLTLKPIVSFKSFYKIYKEII